MCEDNKYTDEQARRALAVSAAVSHLSRGLGGGAPKLDDIVDLANYIVEGPGETVEHVRVAEKTEDGEMPFGYTDVAVQSDNVEKITPMIEWLEQRLDRLKPGQQIILGVRNGTAPGEQGDYVYFKGADLIEG